MKTNNLNKAVSDSISTIINNGIDVNVKIETGTYIKLIFLAILIAAITFAAKYGLHLIKK